MKSKINRFKNKLFAEGKSVIGLFMKTIDPAFVEIAGYAGLNFVILDMEHGPINIGDLQNNIRAALLADIVPIVRVQDNTESSISKALDTGALGIQVPQVKNATEAKKIVERAKFYPEGQRGVCRFVRAAEYSAMKKNIYFKKANENMLILQLEGIEALENIDSIIEVQGIDIIFIGPYDLSQSLGIPGEISNSKVIKKMIDIINKLKKNNIIVGTFVDDPQQAIQWKRAGVQYISYSVDVGLFFETCKNIVKLNIIN